METKKQQNVEWGNWYSILYCGESKNYASWLARYTRFCNTSCVQPQQEGNVKLIKPAKERFKCNIDSFLIEWEHEFV